MRAAQVSGRHRTVALQAVGVAVLSAIVFMVFLRPSEPGDLSGIEAEGNGPTALDLPPPEGKEQKKRGDMSRGASRPDRRNGFGPRALDSSVSGESSEGGIVGGDTPSLEGGGNTPSGDQYDDTVARLMDQVGRPALYREIEPSP
ncbi:MAG: hypothetical protein M3355_11345 [Actinomycetota bacterium]|nr:hypothetical protein [Actinomycetota bacterium]